MQAFIAKVESYFAKVKTALLAAEPPELKVAICIVGALAALVRALIAGVVAVATSLYKSATGK